MSSDENSLNQDQIEAEHDLENILFRNEPGTVENTNTEEVQGSHITDTEDNPGNDEAEEEDKKTLKPKRVIKHPQPKLNEQTLKGPKGLLGLEKCFERAKFKGKGHEEQDLNVIMKMYEYWCHRLFPKFPFDSCIERLEKLGKKRGTVTLLKKIRYDMIMDEDKPIHSDNEEEQVTQNPDGNDFDQLRHLPPLEEPQLSEEQLERIRLNRERAERIRQEKLLRSVASNSQTEGINQATAGTTNVNGLGNTFSESVANNETSEQCSLDLGALASNSITSAIIDKASTSRYSPSNNNGEPKDTVSEELIDTQGSSCSTMRKENEVLKRIREKAAQNVAKSNFLPSKIGETERDISSDSDTEEFQQKSTHFASGSRNKIISNSESD